MLTPSLIDHYRIIPPQLYACFPKEIDPLKLKIVSSLHGQRTNTKIPMSKELFDSISYIETSYDHTDTAMKQPFYHCIGYRKKENTLTILILKQ